jgi:hypothetical protein
MSIAPKITIFSRPGTPRGSVASSIRSQKMPSVSKATGKQRPEGHLQLPNVSTGRPAATREELANFLAQAQANLQQGSSSTKGYAAANPANPREGQLLEQDVASVAEDSQPSSFQQVGRAVGMSFPGATVQGRRSQQVSRHSTPQQAAKILSQPHSVPDWLAWLIALQRRSYLVTFLLVSATLAVYGGTVYTQQLWNREYRQLETLRLQERQYTAALEVLKNQLATQAEQPETGLVPATPSNNLYLPETPQAEKTTPSSITPLKPTPSSQLTPTPLGY